MVLYETIFDFFTRMDDKFINKRQVEFLLWQEYLMEFLKIEVLFLTHQTLVALSQNSQKDRESSQQNSFW